jgi:hypothetical protein
MGGARIRVNRLSDAGVGDSGDFVSISNMKFDQTPIGRNKITLCQDTKWTIIINNLDIIRLDYTLEDNSGAKNPSASGDQNARVLSLTERMSFVSYIHYSEFGNPEKYFVVGKTDVANTVTVYKLGDFGSVVKTAVFPRRIGYVTSLQRIYNKDKSDAENNEY